MGAFGSFLPPSQWLSILAIENSLDLKVFRRCGKLGGLVPSLSLSLNGLGRTCESGVANDVLDGGALGSGVLGEFEAV